MYSKKYIESKLIECFSAEKVIRRDLLFDFLRTFDLNLKESTFNWRLYDLKRRNIIKEIGRGIYTLEKKQQFTPEPDLVMNKIGRRLKEAYNHQFYNIWSTAWLNEFVQLQATSVLYILEVDKLSMEGVFFALKDSRKLSNVFINPADKEIENYIAELPQAIIVAPMLLRAPTMKVEGLIIPTLEKILVDLFCDSELYFAYQGIQLVRIFEAALSKYIINYSRLLNYAKRRHREDLLKDFLLQNPKLSRQVKSVLG